MEKKKINIEETGSKTENLWFMKYTNIDPDMIYTAKVSFAYRVSRHVVYDVMRVVDHDLEHVAKSTKELRSCPELFQPIFDCLTLEIFDQLFAVRHKFINTISELTDCYADYDKSKNTFNIGSKYLEAASNQITVFLQSQIQYAVDYVLNNIPDIIQKQYGIERLTKEVSENAALKEVYTNEYNGMNPLFAIMSYVDDLMTVMERTNRTGIYNVCMEVLSGIPSKMNYYIFYKDTESSNN